MHLKQGQSVLIPIDYGKISLHFQEVMDAKGINRNQLSKLAGIRFEVADRFYRGNIERMDLDVLTRVCFVLDCAVADVMRYLK